MRETVRHALPCRREDHGHFVAHFIEQFHDARALSGVEFQMQAEIEQREFELANQKQAGMKMARGEHALEQIVRQQFAGLPMAREQIQRVALPGEIFHELARQLDRIPLDAVDAGDAGIIDFGQQMMQAVSEFVEQRGHFIVREQRRLLARSAARNCR